MKNLFKNLMLVAVAAMAFTSCSQDVNELNKLEKKTTFEFVASFDGDTRSGFTGSSEDENGAVMYHSEWFGGETVMLVAGDQVVTATVNTEGKFSATFEGEVSQIDIYTPMDSFYKPYMDYDIYQVNPAVLAEQTPLTNSVDPKAHVAKGYVLVDADGNQTIPVSLTHDVAYGKMTVKGVDFEIDHVVVDLKGSFYGSARELSYTLNADHVENNTFWFATEPLEVAEFTVTAYDAEGNAVTKSVDVAAAGKTLAFNYGRVSTFSVSGLEAPVVPAFTSAYTSGYNYNDFYLYFDDETYNLATLKLNPGAMCDADWIMTTGEYQLGVYPGIYANEWYNYSTYGGVSLATGTVKIDIVDKKYHFEFINLADYNGNILIEKATYVGSVTGLNVPDPRTQLVTPDAKASVDGNIITVSWEAVTGADKYVVESYDFETKETTETSVTFEGDYSTTYNFSVKAVALDSNPDYKSSNSCYVSVTTERDPNAVVVEFTSMSYVGTEDTYPMYGEYCHVFELTNSNNYKMNLYVGSYQASSTTISEGSYHYEGKENLGYASTQWGFQSKIWNADGYVGAASSNSTMVVKRSGDVYNIDFTLIINDQTHFFVCNAPIGVQQQPVALETPVVSSSVNGNEVVVSWSAINGAANYTVTLGTQSQTVNGTTVTFSNLEYSTSYTVSVVANPADTTANLASAAGTSSFTTEADPNTGGGSDTGDGDNTDDGEWSGRDVKLNLLAYMDNSLYTNVNGEGKYFMTTFRNGIVAGTFVLAGDNKSYEIMSSGHATSQYGLFGGTTPFADGDTVEVIDNGGGSYTIIYRVTVNGEKLTATYNGGLS